MPQDYAFYSANSGLTPASKYSLDDHMLAWVKAKTSKSFGSVDDLFSTLYGSYPNERAWLLAQTGLTNGTLDELRSAYYAGVGNAVAPAYPTPATAYSNPLTTNGALPAPWTAMRNGGTATIANNKGSFNSTGMGSYTAAQTSLNGTAMPPLSSVDVRFDVGVADLTTQYSYVSFGGDGVNYYPGGAQNGMPKNGYLLQFRTADNTILLIEGISGTVMSTIPWTYVATATGAVPNISVRIRMEGSNLYVRVWSQSVAEPTPWTYTGLKKRVDQSWGYFEVGMLNSNVTSIFYVTNVTIQNLYGTASQVSTMPTTNIISNGKTWNRVYSDDFTVNSTTPRDAARMAEYQLYDDYTGNGKYRDANVTYANSALNIQLRYLNNQSAVSTPSGAAGVLAARSWTGGRFQMRVRADKTAAGGYGAAIMLFPANNVWDEGELDYPEGNFDSNMSLNQHILNGGGNDQPLSYGSGPLTDWDTWHIVTIEWVPGTSIRYYMDGILIWEELTAANVPTTPHNWIIQAATNDGVTPPVGSNGYLQCDWVVVWQ